MKYLSISSLVASIALALGLLTSGCAHHHHYYSSAYDSDRAITHQVVGALNSQPYNYHGVTVTTSSGVVELEGHVDTPAQRAQAAQIASTVPGVRQVIDKLTVTAPTGRAPILMQPQPGY